MVRRIPLLIIMLLLFAVFGFFVQMLHDPLNTLLVVGLSALLFYVVHHYTKTGRFLPASKRVPQIKQKASAHRPPVRKTASAQRKNYPFQVIYGSKGKSKKDQQGGADSSNNLSK